MKNSVPAKPPYNEQSRLKALHGYNVLGTAPDSELDDFVQLAVAISQAPIAAISIVDQDRSWFISRTGMQTKEFPRDVAFCTHVIGKPNEPLVIEDALADPRFADNPHVIGDPQIRFYAGVALMAPGGHALGAVCVMDHEPRQLSVEQLATLRILSRLIVNHIVRLGSEREQGKVGGRKRKKKEVAYALEYSQTILDASPVGIITYKSNGETVDANTASARLIGATIEQIKAQNFRQVDSWRSSGLLDAADQSLTSGAQREIEVHMTSTFGKDIWLLARFVPFVYADELHLLALFRDIAEQRRAEEQFRSAAACYRLLFEQSPYGILLVNPQTGRAVEANEAAHQQLGYTREEFAQLSFTDYDAAMMPEEIAARIKEAVRDGGADFETLHRTKNDEIRNVHVWVKTLSIDDRVLFFVIHQDVTLRRRAENTLRASERELSEAQRLAHCGSWSWNLTGVVRWSDEMYCVFGVARDTFTPTTESLINLIHPEDRKATQTWIESCIAGETVSELVFRIILPDGAVRIISGHGELEYDAKGRPEHMSGTAQDITARIQTDELLQLQSTALNAAANAIVITNRSSEIEWINPAFTQLTGYSYADVKGKTPRLLKSGEHNAAFYQALWETILTGQIWRGQTTNRRKDGSLYTEDQTITPITNAAGDITHFVAIKEDITARLRMQVEFLQAQKMEIVGRFAGAIAHDFNNLLTIILGTADIALMHLGQEDPQRAHFQSMRLAGERAATLTRQILAFSRKQVIKLQTLDVNIVVTQLQSMLPRLIGEDIALVYDLAENSGTVKADPGQLEQVLLNLAVNARDAMPAGGKLVIQTKNVEFDERREFENLVWRPEGYAMLSVSDSGVGMDAATRERIFKPFFTTKEPGKGTGLGLSTVDDIVKRSGGSIRVESKVGRGTTFRIYLPRIQGTAYRQQPRTAAPGPRGFETVLVVEDEADLCDLVRRFIESNGYRVLTAQNGVDALRLLNNHEGPVHLVFTDVVMPMMNGRELAERIKHEHPAVKVLFTSGYTDDAILPHGVIAEDTPFIGKPYSIEDLARKLRDVLDS